MTTLIEQFPYVGIFLLLVLGDMGFPFPEDTTLLLNGFLMAHEVIRPLPALLVAYSGLLVTDFSLYWVGKKYGKKIVEHKRFSSLISPQRLQKIEEKFQRWGVLIVFFGRHLIGIRAQIFVVAGIMGMPPVKFLLVDGASAILTVALMVGIGYWGGNNIQILKEDIARIGHIAILVFLVLLAAWIFFLYFESRRKSRSR